MRARTWSPGSCAAVLGLALAAGITLAASQLSSQRDRPVGRAAVGR